MRKFLLDIHSWKLLGQSKAKELPIFMIYRVFSVEDHKKIQRRAYLPGQVETMNDSFQTFMRKSYHSHEVPGGPGSSSGWQSVRADHHDGTSGPRQHQEDGAPNPAPVEFRISYGNAAEEILAAAADTKAGLIILGSGIHNFVADHARVAAPFCAVERRCDIGQSGIHRRRIFTVVLACPGHSNYLALYVRDT